MQLAGKAASDGTARTQVDVTVGSSEDSEDDEDSAHLEQQQQQHQQQQQQQQRATNLRIEHELQHLRQEQAAAAESLLQQVRWSRVGVSLCAHTLQVATASLASQQQKHEIESLRVQLGLKQDIIHDLERFVHRACSYHTLCCPPPHPMPCAVRWSS